MIAKHKKYKQVYISNHPLMAHKLTLLRDKNTSSTVFRNLVHEISTLLAYEACQGLPTKTITLETPLAKCSGKLLINSKPTVIPIMRAGLGMVDGFIHLLPEARIGHIGLSRNENSFKPERYYFKIPHTEKNGKIFVVDPMLATGGSAKHAITLLKSKGCRDISLVCIIASPEGIENLSNDHPDVPIHIAHIDDRLNDRAYILPGLGDAGDRMYDT